MASRNKRATRRGRRVESLIRTLKKIRSLVKEVGLTVAAFGPTLILIIDVLKSVHRHVASWDPVAEVSEPI